MTKYELRCECGQRIWVPSTDAGRTVPCTCGKVIEIPSLHGLRALANEPPPKSRDERPLYSNSNETRIGVAVVILGLFVAGLLRTVANRSERATLDDFIVAAVIQIATGVVGCALFAKSKGIPVWIGGLVGIFGCLGLIVLFFLPAREIREPQRGRKS